MDKRKSLYCIAAVLIAAIVICFCIIEDRHSLGILREPALYGSLEEAEGNIEGPWITVPSAENKGLEYDIRPTHYEEDSNKYYVILPESVDVTHLVYYVRDTYDSIIARVEGDFTDGVTIQGQQYVYVKSSLPVLYIRPDSMGEFSDLSFDLRENCVGTAKLSVSKRQAKQFLCREVQDLGPIELTLRGAVSRYAYKKSFSLSMTKAKDLLGFGKNKKYNLISEVFDKSHLKNMSFLQMGRLLDMPFIPDAQPVMVYVNSSYQGIYLLTTKVNVDKNRVDLKNGDYFYNLGSPHPENSFPLEMTTWLTDPNIGGEPSAELLYPSAEKISDSQKKEAQSLFQKFISSIEDTESEEYLKYIDLESFAKYYWIQEISMNYDAFGRSMYIYYDKSTEKFYAGPIWDFDETLGNHNEEMRGKVSFAKPEGWKIRYYSWWEALCNHESFMKEAERVYREYQLENVMHSVGEYMCELGERISPDGMMDMAYWDNVSAWLPENDNYNAKDYLEEIAAVEEFYNKRTEWIINEMNR